jgi:hypothetical protein
MAVAVATGGDWWGFPTVQGRVLFVNFEVPGPFFSRRLEQVTRARGVQLKKGDLPVWNLRGFSAPMSVIGPMVSDEVRRIGDVSLIILDPIYKLMAGKDENSAGDQGALCVEMDKVATETGAAIAYGSHFSKGNQAAKESIDRISGSGVTARDPDAIITLTRHEEDGAFTVEPVLRNHPPVDPFVLRWQFPLMERDGGLDPAKLKKAKGGGGSIYSDDDLLQHLADGAELGTQEWYRVVADECGMSERSFHTKRGVLERSKRIRKSAISNKWCLF